MRNLFLNTLIAAITLTAFVATDAEAASKKRRKARPVAEQPADPMKGIASSQAAWNDPWQNRGPNQTAPGYARHEYMPDKVIPLRLREAMNTTLRFPADETIEDVYVSDPVSFEAIIPRSNVVLLRVKIPGADGNVTAMGASGNLYQFYIRGEEARTKIITDISVDVMVTSRSASRIPNMGGSNVGGSVRSASASDLKVEADWLRSIGFRPENIVHDLAIFAPRDGSAGIAPERVFRDGQYTYIDYGANADAINEWPVASLVVQGVETPVNARTAGPNGRMLVVEAVGNIVLRNGNRIVCIKQNGRDPRNPLAPSGSANGTLTRNNAQIVAIETERGRLGASTAAYNVPITDEAGATLPPALKSPSTGKRYAIDLGVGRPEAMQSMWLSLKTSHPSELGSLDASFPDVARDRVGMTPVNPVPGEVKLRAGPIYNMVDAVKACRKISDAGGRCTVVNQTPGS